MRHRAIPAAVLVLALSACSSQEPELPAACTNGGGAFVAALEAAPSAVRVEGVPLSDCLERARDPADLQLVGQSLLEAAVVLRSRAVDGDGDAAEQLGYLLGAARRGAERTKVLHGEIVRRLEQELRDPELDAAALERGRRAGLESG